MGKSSTNNMVGYMRIRLFLIAVLFISANILAQEKPAETPKQKQVSEQFQKEVKDLQDALDKQILPLEGQIYRIQEQIKQLQIEAQKKVKELQDKYSKLYAEAEKK